MEKELVILDIKAPRSINPEISIDVDISINGSDFIPFSAMPNDSAGHDIYQSALKGDFGEITLSPGPDYLWSDGRWVFNESSNPVADAEYLKNLYYEKATMIIAPLQDAVDLEIATEEEKTKLRAWKTYRVLLSRVDTSKPVWPEMP